VNLGPTPAKRLPLSAIVVSRDEAPLLRRCLASLSFCDEIVVVDLESADETAAVAEAAGARVLRRPAVDSVERARLGVVAEARHDWLLYTDPDERVPRALADEVASLLARLDGGVGLVYAPIQYRFRGRDLQGTVWGGPHWRRFLVHRDRVEITSLIYSGTVLRPGYRSLELPFDARTAIVHDWAPGYRELVAKHRRYARVAAADRAAAGETTGWRAIARTPLAAFRESFVDKRGYRDGVMGLLLSLFWAWHSMRSELALKRRLRV
jgi:glycosyltransferase involved in cell wall biosynthesis